MEIPQRHQALMESLLNQILEFEKTYGELPPVQLVLSKQYMELIQIAQKSR